MEYDDGIIAPRTAEEEFQPGDILCRYKRNTDDKGFFKGIMTKLICFFTREWWYKEAETKVYHAEMIHHYDMATQRWQAVTMEPPKCRVRKMPRSRYIVFRLVEKPKYFKNTFDSYVDPRLGQKYDYMKIVACVLDWVFRTRWFTKKIFRDSDEDICSEFVARFYWSYLLINCSKYTPDATKPDDIYDYCLNHPEVYKVIKEVPAV